MTARGEALPPATALQVQTMAELVDSVCDHYPIVILYIERPNEEPSDVAGTIQSLDRGLAKMQLVSMAGFWIPQAEEIELRNITEVLFGSEYEKTLYKVVQLSDARAENDKDAT